METASSQAMRPFRVSETSGLHAERRSATAGAFHVRVFELEARAASALNHPNIVTIYELGQENGTRYIAMEFVNGETVRSLLASGPIPFRKSIAIAAQIAEGLAKAHEIGLIHRDLKPENLMVSKDGMAKVLDFGLAKLLKPDRGSSDSSTAITEHGIMLGTVGYMSPEQALGKPVDARSDVFAFGLIFYELLSGVLPFTGQTTIEALMIRTRERAVPIDSLQTELPKNLARVVMRCLELAQFAQEPVLVIQLELGLLSHLLAHSGDPADGCER